MLLIDFRSYWENAAASLGVGHAHRDDGGGAAAAAASAASAGGGGGVVDSSDAGVSDDDATGGLLSGRLAGVAAGSLFPRGFLRHSGRLRGVA